MKFINQHNNHSCVIASISMLTDNKNYKSIKNYCRKHLKYNVTQNFGCSFLVNEMELYLQTLGHETFRLDSDEVGSFSTLTKNSKAIIFVFDLDTKQGHAMAWNGYKVYDPALQFTKPYSENRWNELYLSKSMGFYIIGIKTPLIRRILNVLIRPYYDVWYACSRWIR